MKGFVLIVLLFTASFNSFDIWLQSAFRSFHFTSNVLYITNAAWTKASILILFYFLGLKSSCSTESFDWIMIAAGKHSCDHNLCVAQVKSRLKTFMLLFLKQLKHFKFMINYYVFVISGTFLIKFWPPFVFIPILFSLSHHAVFISFPLSHQSELFCSSCHARVHLFPVPHPQLQPLLFISPSF